MTHVCGEQGFGALGDECPGCVQRRGGEAMSTKDEARACPSVETMGEHACSNRHQCWEPCGELGHSAAHVRRTQQDVVTMSDGKWQCPWGICNERDAQVCRAATGTTKRTRGCGSMFPPGTTLEQARRLISPSEALLPCPFCGDAPEAGDYSVACRNPLCEAQPSTAGQSQGEAIAAWNRRPEAIGSTPNSSRISPAE